MNQNNLLRDRFLLVIPAYDNFTLKVTSSPIPGVASNPVQIRDTGSYDINVDGDKLDFESAVWQFIVDDDLTNYMELFDWLKENATSQSNLRSDASILIFDATGENVIRKVDILDMAPIALSEVDFGTDGELAQVLTCTVTMRYDQFMIMDPHDGLDIPGYIPSTNPVLNLPEILVNHVFNVDRTGNLFILNESIDGSVTDQLSFAINEYGFLTVNTGTGVFAEGSGLNINDTGDVVMFT